MAAEPNWLSELARVPVIQAPMGGGPSCPALAAAVSEAGGLGFLAAGYKQPDEVRAEIARTRELTDAAFGVNVFVPGEDPGEDPHLDVYLRELERVAEELGVALGDSTWNDDHWDAKVALLVDDPVPVVSFAFGCPSRDVIDALQRAGSCVVVTVTDVEEAKLATERGVDALSAQGIEAGAHRGGFDDDPARDRHSLSELLPAVVAATSVPVIAAGGLMDGADVARASLAAGAVAGQLGTAFLLSPESAANDTYKRALADPIVRPHRPDPRVLRSAGPRPGEPLHARPPRRPGGLPAGQRGDPSAAGRVGPARRPAAHEPLGRDRRASGAGAPGGRHCREHRRGAGPSEQLTRSRFRGSRPRIAASGCARRRRRPGRTHRGSGPRRARTRGLPHRPWRRLGGSS